MSAGLKSRLFRMGMLAVALSMAVATSGCNEGNTGSSNVIWSDTINSSNNCGNLMYDTCRIAPSLQEMKGEQLMDFLGGVVVDGGVNFEVYSEHAERIEVLLFTDPESSQPTMHFPMVKNENSDVWSIFVRGIGVGQYYGYIAWGPNWPYDRTFQPGTTIGMISDCDANGNRFNPNKLLTDPYAKRLHRDFDWGKGSPASGEGDSGRKRSSWGAAAKSVIMESKYEWSANETVWRTKRQDPQHQGHRANDAIYYEVHPKGFTKSALNTMEINGLNLKVTSQGTWRGVGEMAPYLKDLGITAVELLPVMEKPDDGGYWGYNTINFFAPEWKFAAKSDNPNDVVDEFKWMVDQLHQNDIEVVLDVVYNHTGEGGFWESKAQGGFGYGGQQKIINSSAVTLLSFRGLDNAAYYFTSDYNGIPGNGYYDRTGVGNMTRANHTPFRRLIMDSLHYWVEEMHVDGFRFDLASILGIPDGNPGANEGEWISLIRNSVLQDMVDDPVLQKYNVRLIAEPWNIGLYVLGQFPKASHKEGYAWSEWNDHFRDMFRQYVNYDDYSLSTNQDNITIGDLLLGTYNRYGDDGRSPYNSVNFNAVHDGFTTNDVVSFDQAFNGCGELNPECCSNPYNSFCQADAGEKWNKSRAWCGYNPMETGYCTEDGEITKRQMVRNFFALLLLSHGSPLILGGDEWMRSQLGNSNAYSDMSDNAWNWYRWGDWLGRPGLKRMYDFVKKTIMIRKEFSNYLAPTSYVFKDDPQGRPWYWPNDEINNWQGRAVGMYYQSETDPSLLILINMDANLNKTFSLPEAGTWEILMDTQQYYDREDGYLSEHPELSSTESHNVWLDGSNTTSNHYELKPRSIVVLKRSK